MPVEFLIAETKFWSVGDFAKEGVAVRLSKGNGDDRAVIGLCSVFGTVDAGKDVVMPGAFDRAIKAFDAGRSRARFLWQHETNSPPIARITDLRALKGEDLPESLRLFSTGVTGGLLVKREYFKNERAQAVFEAIQGGAIREMSFGYEPTQFDFEERDGEKVRLLKELALFDISDVNFGMNEATMAVIGGPEKSGRMILTTERVKAMHRKADNSRKLAELRAELRFLETRTAQMTPFQKLAETRTFLSSMTAKERTHV